MISCPTCKRRWEAKARYCPACYTVFSTASKNRALAAQRLKGGATWKSPPLFFAVFAGIWFLQVDANDWSAEPGSYQAVSRDMKRETLYLVQSAIDAWSTAGDAWPLRNGDRLGCTPGSSCDAVIYFQKGKSARYRVDRAAGGDVSIVAPDSRSGGLLGNATRGQLVIGAGSEPVSIARKRGVWAVEEPRAAIAGTSKGAR